MPHNMNGFHRALAVICMSLILAACSGNASPSADPVPVEPATATGAPSPATAPAAAAPAATLAAPRQAQAVVPEWAATPAGLAGRRVAPGATAAPALPTATPAPGAESIALVLPTRTPTRAADPVPLARVVTALNVRSGPGTGYPVIGGLDAGSAVPITGRNAAADWWQVSLPDATIGWLYAPLVETTGSTAAVAVAADIPAPPTQTATAAAPTPAPIAQATEPPPAAPAPSPAPEVTGPDFRVVEKRLWDVYENGGFLVGDSVHCGEKRQLVVNVLDANGSRINGVAVQAEYGAREIIVTGSQGRGDGVAEFVLGGGQDVKVIRDSDGRPVSSEMATGLSTNPAGIPYEYLIAAQYCTDEASCKRFVDAPGCYGHYSWSVTFQRSY